jgi:hypothetical protein
LAKNSRWGKTNKKKKEHLCDEITVIMSHWPFAIITKT